VATDTGFVTMTSGEHVTVHIYYPGYDRWLDKYYRDQEGPFEVIIFSPGFGTPATAYEEYLECWASWGFVVAGADWEYEYDRAEDVAYRDHGKVLELLDQMASEGDLRDPFYGVPDTDRAGAVGHSRGGRAAFMATSQENRILCASAWMPTLNDSVAVRDGASLQLFGGEEDEIAPPDEWTDPLYDSVERDIVYLEVFGGGHGTDRDLHPVLALDLFQYHLKGDGSVASGLQGDELKGRAQAGEFRLRMKLGGEEFDSHPELTEEPRSPTAEDGSSTSGLVILILVLIGGTAIFMRYEGERVKSVFRPGPRKRD
jgi:dienelactone hydrolase